MNRVVLLFLFLALSKLGYSQPSVATSIDSMPITSKWIYFKLKDTIKGEIIAHIKSLGGCGVRVFASLSIIKSDKDTIRVLDFCNQNNYKRGQTVEIAPEEILQSSQVTLPFSYIINGQKASKIYNNYDKTVLKTTWGQIIAQ